jgi:hypothetical protein
VARVVAIIISDLPHMSYGLTLELQAFAETRTRHDAQRLANALRHAYGRSGLAQEVEDLLPEAGVLADLQDGRGRQ